MFKIFCRICEILIKPQKSSKGIVAVQLEESFISEGDRCLSFNSKFEETFSILRAKIIEAILEEEATITVLAVLPIIVITFSVGINIFDVVISIKRKSKAKRKNRNRASLSV